MVIEKASILFFAIANFAAVVAFFLLYSACKEVPLEKASAETPCNFASLSLPEPNAPRTLIVS